MNNTARIGIVVALLIIVGVTMAIKHTNRTVAPVADQAQSAVPPATQPGGGAVEKSTTAERKVPRLIDLGATKCIPCKKMAPILAELKKEFAGRLDVEFIDVWENPNAGELYQIRMIPTQIFYDASGKELFRHEGFYGREDILGKWKELGVDLTGKAGGST